MSVISGLSALDNGLRNLIIGGNFNTNPWQRGTTFAGISSNQLSADRWKHQRNGSAIGTISRSADGPTVAQSGLYIPLSLSIAITTQQTSIAAGDYFGLFQTIEGYNFARIAQKPFVCSFWIKATVPGTYCVAFINGGNDRSYISEYTINTANTWEYKTLRVPASPVGGNWNYTNGGGLVVHFTLATGSTFQTAANAWTSGGLIGSSNQVNAVNSTSNIFKIAHVQVESGTDATQFEERDHITELALCQRYYEKSFQIGVAPANAAGTSGVALINSATTATTNNTGQVIYKVRKRTTPGALVLYNPTNNNSEVWNANRSADCTGTSIFYTSETGFVMYTTPNTTNVPGDPLIFHWAADAEI